MFSSANALRNSIRCYQILSSGLPHYRSVLKNSNEIKRMVNGDLHKISRSISLSMPQTQKDE